MTEPSSWTRLIGATLGPYRLEQLLERSESGPVFLARNDAARETYRLRVLATPADLTPEARIVYLGRAQQYASQITALQHASILPLLDYGTYEGIPYLAYPYLTVQTLTTSLAQNGPMDVLLVGTGLDQIAEALEYAHQRAILHRNLTTECIFLKQDRNLVVADFGVMRLFELSRQDEKGGALYGMNASSAPAPEQILGNPVDTYTDVYALGAVLYRMLTGHRVFQGKSRDEIVQQHISAPVPLLSKWRSGLPAELDSVIAKAMAKDPARRFRYPRALADAYHQVVAPNDKSRKPFVAPTAPAVPLPASMSASPMIQRNAQKRVSRRRAMTFIAAGGGAVAAIAVLGILGSRYLGSNTSPPSPASTTQQGRILARASDIPLNSDKQFALPNSNNPGLLIHLPDNRFVAFDSTCPHAGCAVSYNGQDKLLECPCHGATFDPARNAAVVHGPAQSPLTPITITVNADGTIAEGNTPSTSPTSTTASTAAATPQGQVLARASDVPLNSAKQFPLPNKNNPGLLVHLSDNRFVAFDSTCTHAGCAVSYNAQDKLLECPCHGAAFDPARNAAVVHGPAQSPLAPITISVNPDGSIMAK